MAALIIVPTYNERDNVRAVAEAFLAPVAGSELLFVDDGSPDGTGDLIDEICQGDPRVHVLHRAGKLGLGSAYREGFAWGLARGFDLIFEMDADFSHDPKYLPVMCERARGGGDMVVGSRYIEGGGTVNWGLGRQLISRMGGLYARTVLGVPVRDLTSGFVCYRRETLEAIDLSAVRSSGYGFQIEMKYRVISAGLTIAEIPIVFEDRRVGQSKMSGGIALEALGMVWKLRLGR
ncbi:MAG TPA: polyprenol monophosphomannose synthase [Kofleriaceae bacterium]|nr:polyprenol monophosphomannose synthase [Kofleriaceae bacterium]